MQLAILKQIPRIYVEDSFFDADGHGDLLADTLAQARAHSPSSVTVVGNSEVIHGAVDPSIRIASSRRLSAKFHDRFREALVARQGAIAEAIGISFPLNFGLEIECVHSGDGAFFAPHTDTLRGGLSSHRIISAVYYYSRKRGTFSGGQLRLWSLDRSASVTIEPTDNSIIVFPSIFPHEVLPVSVPSRAFADGRFSVNCWVHQMPHADSQPPARPRVSNDLPPAQHRSTE